MRTFTFQNGETHDVYPDGTISFHMTVDFDEALNHGKTWLSEKASVEATGTKLMKNAEFSIIMGDGGDLTLQVMGNVTDLINVQVKEEGKGYSC